MKNLLHKIHHIAIICADYAKSKHFYTEILGLEIVREVYRQERDSYKLDLSLNGEYIIELFSFPDPPKRLSRPEATGLRHLAFEVEDLESVLEKMEKFEVAFEPMSLLAKGSLSFLTRMACRSSFMRNRKTLKMSLAQRCGFMHFQKI